MSTEQPRTSDARMRAVLIERFGGPDALVTREVERPVPKPGEVLVRIRASALNPLDCHVRSGKLWFVTGRRFPKTLGAELSGEVVGVGDGASRFTIGDAVFGFVDLLAKVPGSYAEYVTVPERWLAAKPDALTHAEAAALPIAGMTALVALRELAHAQAGQRALIVGASGGVGAHAIQIAKHLGLDVTGVSSAKNVAFVRELGADRAMDYEREDPAGDTSEPYDTILDMSESGSFWRFRRALAPAGVYVTTIPGPGAMLTQALTSAFGRRRAHALNVSGHASSELLGDIAEMAARGTLRPIVERVVPLRELPEAHAAIERGGRRGKTVVDVALA